MSDSTNSVLTMDELAWVSLLIKVSSGGDYPIRKQPFVAVLAIIDRLTAELVAATRRETEAYDRIFPHVPQANGENGQPLSVVDKISVLITDLAAMTADRNRLGVLAGAWRSVPAMALRHLVGDWPTSVRESDKWTCPHDAAEALRLRIEALKAELAAVRADARMLSDEREAAQRRAEAAEAKYSDLIMAVVTKFPGETRHDTAKRYIEAAERASNEWASADRESPANEH